MDYVVKVSLLKVNGEINIDEPVVGEVQQEVFDMFSFNDEGLFNAVNTLRKAGKIINDNSE